MTDREKREQRVQLRIDLEDAESDLAHLRERAIRVAVSLEAIVRKIRQNAALEPSRNSLEAAAESRLRLSNEELEMLKNSSGLIPAALAELGQARRQVFQLRERDAALTRVGRATQI
jgi:hypothetical protein